MQHVPGARTSTPLIPVRWHGSHAYTIPSGVHFTLEQLDDGDTKLTANKNGTECGFSEFYVQPQTVFINLLVTDLSKGIRYNAPRHTDPPRRAPGYLGTTIIRLIRDMFPGKWLKLNSVHRAVGFYEKMGFHKSDGGSEDVHHEALTPMALPPIHAGRPDAVDTSHGYPLFTRKWYVSRTVVAVPGTPHAHMRDLTFDVSETGKVTLLEGGHRIAHMRVSLDAKRAIKIKAKSGSDTRIMLRFLRNTFPGRTFAKQPTPAVEGAANVVVAVRTRHGTD